MQRHHGALAEADQRKRRGCKLAARELRIDETFEARSRLVDPEPALVLRALLLVTACIVECGDPALLSAPLLDRGLFLLRRASSRAAILISSLRFSSALRPASASAKLGHRPGPLRMLDLQAGIDCS